MARIAPSPVTLLASIVLLASALLASAAAANEAPVISGAPSEIQRDPGQLLLFNVSTSDPDGDRVTLEAANVPAGARFLLDGNGNGSFSWRPLATDEGFYVMTLVATDNGSPMMMSTMDVAITIGEPNLPPVLDPIGDQMAIVGMTLVVQLSATDPEGDALVFSTDPVLSGSLISNGPTGATFEYTPNAGAVGNQVVTFFVSDGTSMDEETIVITVGDANVPPMLQPIGDRMVEVDMPLSVTLMAEDVDGDALAFAADGLPDGVMLTDRGDGTALLEGTPSLVGLYSVTVTVTDDGTPNEAAAETFVIDVQAPPPPPDPELEIIEARWEDDQLHVMGEGAPADSEVDLVDASTGASVGTTMADADGFFVAHLRPFVPPCSVEAHAADEASPVMAVADAPAGCSQAPPTRVWVALWNCRTGLGVAGHHAAPHGMVRVYDADTSELLGSTTAGFQGQFFFRSQPDPRPEHVQVSVEADGIEWMLDPVSVRSVGRCSLPLQKHHAHRGHHHRHHKHHKHGKHGKHGKGCGKH